MKLTSKTYGNELEIMTMKGNAGTTIIVEVFTVPEGYKSFARNNLVHHFDLEGYGVHKDKQKSVDLAVKDLEKQIEICKTSLFAR